jgi:elongation factor 1-gamma
LETYSFVAPAKEAPKKKEAPAPKPKEKEAPKKKEKKEEDAEEDDDDGVHREKAPKHPLAALPPSSIPIDEWKRQYSNNDTDVALKWFWEHYNPKDFSLWRVDYKVRSILFPELT